MATTVTLKPNAIDLSGSTSGTTTLQATAVAGTTTITLPAATDTLVGKATTDTLTNKTLTSPTITGGALNGSLGATTPSTVAATSITASTTLGVTGTTTLTVDASISGLTVGKGGGAVANNTAIGASSLNATNTGTGLNTAVGAFSLFTNTSGSESVAVGYEALRLNTTGAYNVALGQGSLRSNTTAQENTAVGNNSMRTNTTGASNSVLGASALGANTTGGSNTAIGYNALVANTTANNNTAVGYQAGYGSNGGNNVFHGYKAGYANATGGQSVMIGANAGLAHTDSDYNVFVGYNSGSVVTTGDKNTIIGSFTGNQGGLDIRTASNYIVLSDGDGNPKGYFSNTNYGEFTLNASASQSYNGILNFATATTIKAQAYHENSSSQWKFVNGGTGGVYLASGGTSWVSMSDERTKENLVPIENGLTKVCSLRSVIGNFISDETKKKTPFLIAQDVQAVLPEAISTTMVKDDETNTQYLGVSYTDVIPLLVASIKELKQIVDTQAAEIAELKAKVGI